jgi:hypothetical protein
MGNTRNYLLFLSICTVGYDDYYEIIKWKGSENNQLRLHFRYCPGSYLEQLKKATK